jgi:hypothetical protein
MADLSHAYLGSDIVSVPKLTRNVVLIKGKHGESVFVIYSTHYTDKGILYKRNKDVNRVSEHFLNSLDAQVETNLPIDCEDGGRLFPVQSESYLIFSGHFLGY